MKTLNTKLSVALLGCLAIIGAIGAILSWRLGQRQVDEILQRVHASLATNLLAANAVFREGSINAEGLEHIFSTLMVVNPSIEVYLLGIDGEVLQYSSPDRGIDRDRVDLAAVRAFLTEDAEYPIYGTDPRSLETAKVFSVSPVTADGRFEGYLYIVLGSELFAGARAAVSQAGYWRWTILGIGAVGSFAIAIGLIVFLLITRRVRALTDQVVKFQYSLGQEPRSIASPRPRRWVDELQQLHSVVFKMSAQIVQQMDTIKKTDCLRRQLIANISHDLKTPLASLRGYVQTVQLKGEALTPKVRGEYLAIAAKSANRLTEMIDELFDLARLESQRTAPQLETFPLAELINDVLQKFQLSADKREITLETNATSADLFVRAELGMIERVFENLISNAMRYTPAKGRISVLVNASGDNHVKVSVCDTGSGIAERNLPFILNSFYRPDSIPQSSCDGSGLGLAIVRRILELHQSTIRAESRVGNGSQFTFDLPLAAA